MSNSMMNQPWIYLVLLGAVIAVIGWIRPAKEQKGMDFQHNMEETLEHYVQEVAEENDKLLRVIEKMKLEQDARHDASRRRMDKLEAGLHIIDDKVEALLSADRSRPLPETASLPQIEEIRRQVGGIGVSSGESAAAYSTDEQAVEHLRQRMSIRERYSELFERLDHGMDAAEAAEQLGMKLGEVQLIVQLAVQEGQRA